ncbi:MAG: hypothetical protein ACI32N_09920 [Bulleidia sp.]
MSKLKKSNVRKKSGRALERELALQEEERKKAEELETKKKKSQQFTNTTMDLVFPIYTLACAILGFLFAQLGIFSFIGIILGVIGLKRHKGKPRDKYFWINVVSLAVCVICAGYWLFVMGYLLITKGL